MAARKRRGAGHNGWDQSVRERIKTSMLVKRLTSFALGLNDPQTNKPIDMSAAQVTAALGVLKKALPDLAQVEHSGEVNHQYVARIPLNGLDADEWEAQQQQKPLPN